MTLYLEIHSISQGSFFESSDLILTVQGSQSGSLKSKQLGSDKTWHPPFKVTCSSSDELIISLYPLGKTDQDNLLGFAPFHATSFIKNHRDELRIDKDLEHQITLEKNDKEKGTLRVTVRYDKAKKYQGQLIAPNSMNLGDYTKKNVEFYKGRCLTTNLFSFMDPAAQGQQFKAIQKIYRDQ